MASLLKHTSNQNNNIIPIERCQCVKIQQCVLIYSTSRSLKWLFWSECSGENCHVIVNFSFCYRDVIYTGPKKVTITVKETKTETGFPGETELISQHVVATHAPAASSATRELDDLMADLSNIKVSRSFDSLIDIFLEIFKIS